MIKSLVNISLDRLAHVISSVSANRSVQGRDLSKIKYVS